MYIPSNVPIKRGGSVDSLDLPPHFDPRGSSHFRPQSPTYKTLMKEREQLLQERERLLSSQQSIKGFKSYKITSSTDRSDGVGEEDEGQSCCSSCFRSFSKLGGVISVAAKKHFERVGHGGLFGPQGETAYAIYGVR